MKNLAKLLGSDFFTVLEEWITRIFSCCNPVRKGKVVPIYYNNKIYLGLPVTESHDELIESLNMTATKSIPIIHNNILYAAISFNDLLAETYDLQMQTGSSYYE